MSGRKRLFVNTLRAVDIFGESSLSNCSNSSSNESLPMLTNSVCGVGRSTDTEILPLHFGHVTFSRLRPPPLRHILYPPQCGHGKRYMSSGVSSTGIRLVGAPELSAGANALAGICIGNCFLHFGQPTFTMPGLSGRYILKGWRHSGLGHVTFNIGLSVSDIVVVGFRIGSLYGFCDMWECIRRGRSCRPCMCHRSGYGLYHRSGPGIRLMGLTPFPRHLL